MLDITSKRYPSLLEKVITDLQIIRTRILIFTVLISIFRLKCFPTFLRSVSNHCIVTEYRRKYFISITWSCCTCYIQYPSQGLNSQHLHFINFCRKATSFGMVSSLNVTRSIRNLKKTVCTGRNVLLQSVRSYLDRNNKNEYLRMKKLWNKKTEILIFFPIATTHYS